MSLNPPDEMEILPVHGAILCPNNGEVIYTPEDVSALPIEDVHGLLDDTNVAKGEFLQSRRHLERDIGQQSSRRLVRGFLAAVTLSGGIFTASMTDPGESDAWVPPTLFTSGVVLLLSAFNAHMRIKDSKAELLKTSQSLETVMGNEKAIHFAIGQRQNDDSALVLDMVK